MPLEKQRQLAQPYCPLARPCTKLWIFFFFFYFFFFFRALHSAVAAQQKACIQYLAAEGADVNGQDHKGSTPLHVAACEGKLEYVKLLISLGASCASKDHM